MNEEKCKICGCTNDKACDGGCWWVAEELCSKCANKLIEENVELKKQLKDKNEKINKAKEFILENTYEQIEYLDNVSQYYDRKLNNILEILESNKED